MIYLKNEKLGGINFPSSTIFLIIGRKARWMEKFERANLLSELRRCSDKKENNARGKYYIYSRVKLRLILTDATRFVSIIYKAETCILLEYSGKRQRAPCQATSNRVFPPDRWICLNGIE